MDGHEADPLGKRDHRFGKARLLALVLVSALGSTVASLTLSFTDALGQARYPLNGGFEDGVSHWNVSYGATFITVTEPVSSGNYAASLTMSDTTAEIQIYQDVPIFSGATYTLTGWVYKDESAIEYAEVRLKWDSSTGEYFARLTDNRDFYRPLTVGPLVAPPDATEARVRAVVKIRTANPPNPVYFDELSLTCNLTPRLYSPLLLRNYPR